MVTFAVSLLLVFLASSALSTPLFRQYAFTPPIGVHLNDPSLSLSPAPRARSQNQSQTGLSKLHDEQIANPLRAANGLGGESTTSFTTAPSGDDARESPETVLPSPRDILHYPNGRKILQQQNSQLFVPFTNPRTTVSSGTWVLNHGQAQKPPLVRDLVTKKALDQLESQIEQNLIAHAKYHMISRSRNDLVQY